MSWLTSVRNALSFVAEAGDARQAVAQVQGLRADGVRQGAGGKSLRLPALRPSRSDRAEGALRQIFDEGSYEQLAAPRCPRIR